MNKQSLIVRNKPLLVVCGCTATGKTKLALHLSKVFNGELISADSRQVYKYMDIGTGKDINKYGKIMGYDLVNPNEEFNISYYSKFAKKAIDEIYKRNHLPILVGGSGFYIKSVIQNISTISIPANKILRENLRGKTTSELIEILANVDSKKLQLMNNSDRNNPRRLIRAIEVAASTDVKTKNNSNYDVLYVGLTIDTNELKKRIEKRVDERVEMGFSHEIKFLKENNYWEGAPSRTLGYKDWPNVDQWKVGEFKYAKRQMTWFKKEKQISWFNISNTNFTKEVEKLVKKWYSQVNNAS